MPVDRDKESLEEWKNKIKNAWEYGRKLVIFEDANGNLIIPTTTTSTTTTTTTTQAPVTTKNTSFFTSPVVVINETTVTPKSDDVALADTADLIKIIGITCGALVFLLILSLVCIRLCRVSAKKRKERVSVRRPLNLEPEEHIYAEIEPLQRVEADGPSRASASGSSGVPLPSKKGKKRRRGVSSFRAFSTRIYKWFSTERAASDDNQSVFYNRSGESSSVQNAPEPPNRNIVNGRTKRGRGTGVKRNESQSRRPLLDGDSQISTTSSNLDPRDNVYNPLLRIEGRVSGPYDHLRLSKTQSGTVKDPDQAPPQSPHDYFTLERETNNEEKTHPTASYPMENIDEVDTEDNKLDDNIVGEIEKALQENDDVSETPKNHDYFILEPTHATVESPSKSSVKTKSSIKDDSARHKVETSEVTAAKSETSEKTSPVKSSGSSKSKPVPKPRSLGSPTKDKNPPSVHSNDLLVHKSELKKSSGSAEQNHKNLNTSLSDAAAEKQNKENASGKDEEYVLTKLGDAPKPPEIPPDHKDTEDYLKPIKNKPDYVEVCPNPPPRTTSKSPSVSPAPSRTNSKEYPLVTPIHTGTSMEHEPSKSPTKEHSRVSPQQEYPLVTPIHTGTSEEHEPSKSLTKEHSRVSPLLARSPSEEKTSMSPKPSVTTKQVTTASPTHSVETDV